MEPDSKRRRAQFLQLLGHQPPINEMCALSVKEFYEIAAHQSGITSSNVDIPDVLLSPLIRISDPDVIKEFPFANMDWRTLENRITASFAAGPSQELLLQEDNWEEEGFIVEESGCVNFNTTSQLDRSFGNASFTTIGGSHDVSMRGRDKRDDYEDVYNIKNIEKKKAMSKEILIERLCETCKKIRRASETVVLAPLKPWIGASEVDATSNTIVIAMSFMPGVLSVVDVVSALLVPSGPEVLAAVVQQMPELVQSFFNAILEASIPDRTGPISQLREKMLHKLLEIYPVNINYVLEVLAKSRIDCVIGFRIAVEILGSDEFLKFLEPQLADRESPLSHIIQRNSRIVSPFMFTKMLNIAAEVDTWNDPAKVSSCDEVSSSFASRLVFCLVELLWISERWSHADISLITRIVFRLSIRDGDAMDTIEAIPNLDEVVFNGDDSIVADSQDAFDSLVTTTTPRFRTASVRVPMVPSPFGDAHETFVLAALVAVPYFTQYPTNQTAAVSPPDPAVAMWLDAARRRTYAQYEPGKNQTADSSFGGALLYVHSCILAGKLEDLAKFASEILKRKVEISHRNAHGQILKSILFSNCLDESEVARRCVAQSITPQLNENSAGRLPLHSIYPLQASGFLRIYNSSIGDWLERQLRSVTTPANAMLAEVVETFAHNSAVTRTSGLSAAFLNSVFCDEILQEEKLMTRVYALLYLVSYREHAERSGIPRNQLAYQHEVFTQAPYRYLLSVVELRHSDFESIRYRVVSRCASLFPHMMPTALSLEIAKKYQSDCRCSSPTIGHPNVVRRVQNAVTQPLKPEAYPTLKQIHSAPLGDQVSLLPVVMEAFMASLDPKTPVRFVRLLVEIFSRYEEILPRVLYETAADFWLRDDGSATSADVYKLPIVLFRCDRRILNSPPHFRCFIDTLRYFSAACRWDLRMRIAFMHKSHAPDQDRRDNEHLALAYVDSQDACVVQALIEVADSERMNDEASFTSQANREEIARTTLEYIHRLFIDQDGLMKIVLFQAFPLRQLRAFVDGVPSMFVAVSFMQDMLTFPQLERRIFAVTLMAELARKYCLPETLEMARMTLDLVYTLHKYGELPPTFKIWKHLAPALTAICSTFPFLTDAVVRLLERVVAGAKSRLATRYGLLPQDSNCDEKKLIELVGCCLDREKHLVE